jgi:hypothetical protein
LSNKSKDVGESLLNVFSVIETRVPHFPCFVSFSFFVFFVPILSRAALYDLGPGSRRDERI